MGSTVRGDSLAATKIIIVEDELIVARSFARLIEAENACAIIVSTVQEALVHPARFTSGWLVDYRLPDGTGIELLSALRERGIVGPALLVTGLPSVALAGQAASFGAPLCEKPLEAGPLLRLVRAVRQGTFSSQPPNIDAIVDEVARALDLTIAERRLVARRLEGVARGELAERLGTSANTIKTHTRTLLKKAGKGGYASQSMEAFLFDVCRRHIMS